MTQKDQAQKAYADAHVRAQETLRIKLKALDVAKNEARAERDEALARAEKEYLQAMGQ